VKDQTIDTDPGRSLLTVAFYLVGLALLVDGLAQALVVGGPEAPMWSVRWRFGFTGIVYLHLPLSILGLTILSLTAGVVRQRWALLASFALQGVVAIAALLGLLLFLLDATQIGAGVPESLRGGFTITVAQTAVTGGLGTALLMALAFGSVRMARHLRSTRRMGPADSRSGLVVGREG